MRVLCRVQAIVWVTVDETRQPAGWFWSLNCVDPKLEKVVCWQANNETGFHLRRIMPMNEQPTENNQPN